MEGSTEIVLFSSFALNLLLKKLKEKTSEQLEKLDKLVEETTLSEEKEITNGKEKVPNSFWARKQRDEYKSSYVVDESKFWKNFNEIKIVPIFGKFGYIFFAKISESLLLGHKFVLDEDKEVLDEEEITDWGKFYDTNSSERRDQQLKSWKKYETSPQEAQKAWNEGWRWPNHKLFFDSTSYCKTGEKNNCYCNNIIWIRGELEKFINLKKTREFGKTPEMNLIENLPDIVEKLVNSESEKWRVILKPFLREWGWEEYKLCRRNEIKKYRNE